MNSTQTKLIVLRGKAAKELEKDGYWYNYPDIVAKEDETSPNVARIKFVPTNKFETNEDQEVARVYVAEGEVYDSPRR